MYFGGLIDPRPIGGAAPRPRHVRGPRPTKAPASRQLSALRQGHRPAHRSSGPHSYSLSTPITTPDTMTNVSVCRLSNAGRGALEPGIEAEPCCFSRYVRIAARTVFSIVNNVYCIPAYVVWMMALRPVRPFFSSLYWKIEGLLFHWLLAMVALWTWSAGYEIVESGDEPVTCTDRRTLVLANHQSTADVPMLMTAWNPRPGLLPNLMWIMDRVFMYTNFGVVSMLHEDFFIQAGRKNRDQSLELLRRHLRSSYLPLQRQFMVLFPEGGFLHKRREISQRFADKNNLPRLEYVTIPRAGALGVIMEEVGPRHNNDELPSTSHSKKDGNSNQNNVKREVGSVPAKLPDHLEWVLDVTIAYEDRIPLHLYDIVCGIRPPCTTHIHYRVYHGSEVPNDTEGMTKWLYDRFIEKDELLRVYYATGSFPERGPAPHIVRQVRQDNLRFLIIHLFFLASSLLQLQFAYFLFGLVW